MRTNLENSRLFEPRISGLRLAPVAFNMTGTLTIGNDMPTVWALNGGLSDRTVRLPVLSQDKQIVIGNIGTTNTITVTDSNGSVLVVLPINTGGVFFAGVTRWVWITDSFLNVITTTVVTVSGSVATSDIEVQVNGVGVVVLTLPLSASWTSIAGWTGLPLSIYDISGNALVNNITINPSGGQTISGQASLTIANNYGGYNLRPKNGGGWIFR